jgi:hypothetical protein
MTVVSNEYFKERMTPLGVADINHPNNQIRLWQYDSTEAKNILKDVSIFRPHEKGIEILVYTIDRDKIRYQPSKSHTVKDYSLIRLSKPVVKANGDVQKYQMPFGQATRPFFPPGLLDKYDAGTKLKVLYLTEGYFKAFMAQLHGIDCIGLPSITCMRDKSGKLHQDILKLIERCRPERIIWLTDGDCRSITSKEITEETDLATRPTSFYKTVTTFHDLLSFSDSRLFWAHINSERLPNQPKGIDDLLIECADKRQDIADEFNGFELDKGGKLEGQYLVRFEVTLKPKQIYKYFMLDNVTKFYLHHLDRRPDLQGQVFKFFGSQYQYDEKEEKCVMLAPSSADNYFRVGDTYYEFIEIPDQTGALVRTFHKRDKTTITDDHGSELIKFIPKYKAFCNVPGHVDYQRYIANCFNMYAPFIHEAQEGDCETTLSFVKHIFGSDAVQLDEHTTVPRYELGLDYLTILYKFPTQILPILCLVSKARQTGKTTFNKWLKMIFDENMAIVGNADLASDFNAPWVFKLVVAVDEAKIDRVITLEKVKSLSTATEIVLNAKNKDQQSIKFFAKFILNSNSEDNFINIDSEEIRFWIIKVPVLEQKNIHLVEELRAEIPAFLHYLDSRKMVTTAQERHWFKTELLYTDALKRVIEQSKPGIEKQLRITLSELFIATGLEQIHMSLNTIAAELLKRPLEKNYINTILDNMGYKLGRPQRASYPRLIEVNRSGSTEIEFTMVKYSAVTRCFTFERVDFVDAEHTHYLPDSLPPFALAS